MRSTYSLCRTTARASEWPLRNQIQWRDRPVASGPPRRNGRISPAALSWKFMNDRRALIGATNGLRNNLCEFPSMFAKSVVIQTADVLHSATATLVDLGHGPLAVTCAHVISAYLEMWRAGKKVVLRIGKIRVSPSRVAGLDAKDLDLATMRLSDEQAADLVSEDGIAAQSYQPTRWPSERAKEGQSAAIGGFPAQWRQKRADSRGIMNTSTGFGCGGMPSCPN